MDSPGKRLLQALELSELTEAIFRERLKREQPKATASEIEHEVRVWRQRRPGAEFGDAIGRPRMWHEFQLGSGPSRKR